MPFGASKLFTPTAREGEPTTTNRGISMGYYNDDMYYDVTAKYHVAFNKDVNFRTATDLMMAERDLGWCNKYDFDRRYTWKFTAFLNSDGCVELDIKANAHLPDKDDAEIFKQDLECIDMGFACSPEDGGIADRIVKYSFECSLETCYD
jgi:hypothetical protein